MELRKPSAFGLEFLLLILLPALVLVAGAATASLAFRSGFTPLPEPDGIIVNPR